MVVVASGDPGVPLICCALTALGCATQQSKAQTDSMRNFMMRTPSHMLSLINLSFLADGAGFILLENKYDTSARIAVSIIIFTKYAKRQNKHRSIGSCPARLGAYGDFAPALSL